MLTRLTTYHYDPLNRLCASGAREYFYSMSRLRTEQEGTLQRSVFQSGDHLLAQQDCHDGRECTVLLATDGQRTVTQVTGSHNSPSLGYGPYGQRECIGV